MDNGTYDEVNLTPLNTDETYSRLRTPQTRTQLNNDLQRKADINQSMGVKQTKTNEASNNTKFNTLLITMMVILLLFTLVSIALSVMIFSRLPSEQSKLVSQLNENQSQILTQLDNRINRLTSEQYKLVSQLNENEDIHTTSVSNLTQLIMTQSNISQILAQLDKRSNNIVPAQTHDICPQIQSHCGAGLWWRVAYLNMTDPSQKCPPAWREYTTGGVKACGRPVTSTGSCITVSYLTNRQYSRVCGRIIGYQVASPDAFKKINPNNGGDLDGVIVSHGVEHDYIWSYVAGLTENSSSHATNNCPCSSGEETEAPTPFIEDNKYYCESGNPTDAYDTQGHLYSNDKLWDGQQCSGEGTCCTGNNSPPWFSIELPTPTTDVIEVSICCDQDTTDEDTPVELMEIYVQ